MTFGSRRQFGGPGLRGLGYTVSAGPPYFTPDSLVAANGSVNGIPTTAISLDSFMQEQVASDVNGAAGEGRMPQGGQVGVTPSAIQAAYRTMAERQCQAYSFTCPTSPDTVADTYSALLFRILQGIPAPQSAKSYGTMYNYLFNGGYAADAAGQSQLTGQLPAPAVTPAMSAPVQTASVTPAAPFGTTAVVATTPAALVPLTSQTQTAVGQTSNGSVAQTSNSSTSDTSTGLSTTDMLAIAAGIALLFFTGKK